MKPSNWMAKVTILAIGMCALSISIAHSGENRRLVQLEVPSEWFQVSRIDENTFAIEEKKGAEENVSYLIVGSDKALLFDTGAGENEAVDGRKITHVIEQLTEFPVTVLPSHFHSDHIANINEFDRIAFPDLKHLRAGLSDAKQTYHFSSEELLFGTEPGKTNVDEWLPLDTDIEFAGRAIKLVHVPGHTMESIMLVDRTNKYAFMGDFLYNGAKYVFGESSLDSYRKSAETAVSVLDTEYRLFGAHGKPEMPYSNLELLPNFLSCVQSKECASKPESIFGSPALGFEYKDMKLILFDGK